MPVAAEDLHDVGEVLLALAVVGRYPLDRVGEQRAVERVAAGVELVDSPLRRRGVALLHDPQERTVSAAHDPPEAREIAPRGQHGDGVASLVVRVDELLQGRTAQQRHVPVGDDDRARHRSHGLDNHPHGMARAKLLILDDDVRMRRCLGGRRAHLLPRVPDDDHESLRRKVAGGGDRVPEQRTSRKRVQHLGSPGLHPGALACCEDHNRGRGSFAHEQRISSGIGPNTCRGHLPP